MNFIFPVAACALFAAASPPVAGQTWPTKPIRLVAPNAPGGGSDAVARVLAERLAPALGQQILVENRAGAGGRLAGEFVAKAAPDGYTLLMGTGATLVTVRALYAKASYDPVRSFAPISRTATTAYLLVAHPSVPAASVKQLIAVAKSRPGGLTIASTGGGSPNHLAAELFQSLAGVRMVHVPYKGSAPGTLSVIQGETDLMFGNLVAALPHANSRRLKTLGISSAKRSAIVPDVPTIAEAGLPGFVVEQFYGLVAPAGTPGPIIKRLNDEVVARMPAPEVKRILEAQGTEVAVSTPDELSRLIATEIDRWTAIIQKAGIKPE
ncbi:MAG TPA: tripartite tricarboxylate transporter substrate binding protein [Burkholderiales bacterium]|nr:tripartite tricarboxylate transporter substrate binding protein [Burkholderiales bacterium]